MKSQGNLFERVMLFIALSFLFCFIPFFIIKMINTTIMSYSLNVFREQYVAVFIAICSIYLIMERFVVNKNGKKIFLVVLAVSAICNFETPSEFTKREFNKYYDSIVKDNSNFETSDIAKELKAAINTLDYDKLNLIFKDSNLYRSSPNKKVEGLSESELLEKKIIVKAINNPDIENMFNELTEKGYVTLNEYEEFKNKVSVYEEKNQSLLSQDQKLYLSKLLLTLK